MDVKKVVIVDDELPARKLLKEYLQGYPELKILAECKNGIEAIGVINVLHPDIVFLDIQMPGKTGFEVLQEIDHFPLIIFTTAFDQYALKAFEVNAIDYLLKPYTLERFQLAIQRSLCNNNNYITKISSFAEKVNFHSYPARIFVEDGTRLLNIPIEDVTWLQASGDYTLIYTRVKQFLSTKGISEIEKKLNPQHFQRIHRSSIIALNAVQEIQKETYGSYAVLSNGQKLKISRSYLDAIRKFIL